MVGIALKTELDIAVDTEIVGAGEVSSTSDAGLASCSTGDAVLDGTVTGAGVGHIIEGVEAIDTGDAACGVGAVDAVGGADHTLTSGWRDGELCAIAGLTGVGARADQTVRIGAGETIAVEEGDN